MSTKELLDPIKPGEILKDDFMEPLNISMKQLAKDISVPFNRISEIVNGKGAVTVDTALRLQRYFGIEAQFWLNLQSEYDLRMMKQQIWTDIEQKIIPVQRFDINRARANHSNPLLKFFRTAEQAGGFENQHYDDSC